jgi:2,3-bisphosphoglycerate-independent phosphoglycerate mutase
MVPSPKVATYNLQPEMSCAGVADKVGLFYFDVPRILFFFDD